ncbi:MAG: dTDP-4-dehydrorhamnose reductase [Flaviflexus sp.]|nr:dTDP-4-dehydrorhamnose reductase [Flaviflexus sp.]
MTTAHWMIIGGDGMLGTELVELVRSQGRTVTPLTIDDLDITDPAAVADSLDGADIIVNCSGYTAVDKAEEDEALAFAVNATGPQLLARRARELGARFVHISTDYVFAGDATEPYRENDAMAPAGAYGRTKAAGEWAVRAETDDYLIVRTAWLYGAAGPCFPKTMARLAAERDELAVVIDEVGQPTWTRDLSDLIIRLVDAEAPAGIYHGTSSGQTNWHGFTRAIVASLGKDPAMVGETTAAAFNRPAPRPSYSVLDHGALTALNIAPIGPWEERWEAAASSVLGA